MLISSNWSYENLGVTEACRQEIESDKYDGMNFLKPVCWSLVPTDIGSWCIGGGQVLGTLSLFSYNWYPLY